MAVDPLECFGMQSSARLDEFLGLFAVLLEIRSSRNGLVGGHMSSFQRAPVVRTSGWKEFQLCRIADISQVGTALPADWKLPERAREM